MRQYIMADFNIVTLLVLLQWNLRLGGRAHCGILHRLQCCRLRWIQVRILGVAPHGRFPMVCPCIHIEELCSTLLGELFIALFLLLCATYFSLHGVALFFVLFLTVGHLLHRPRGAALCLALILDFFSTGLHVISSILSQFQVRIIKIIKITCSVTVVYWRDIASCNSGRQTCLWTNFHIQIHNWELTWELTNSEPHNSQDIRRT